MQVNDLAFYADAMQIRKVGRVMLDVGEALSTWQWRDKMKMHSSLHPENTSSKVQAHAALVAGDGEIASRLPEREVKLSLLS